MAKRSDGSVARLCEAMHSDRKVLEYTRRQRTRAIRQFAGPSWSEATSDVERPANLIDLYVRVMLRNLVAKNPRVMLSTFDRGLKPAVKVMEEWSNCQIEKMELAGILQRAVIDALFCYGTIKVGLAAPADSGKSAWSVPAGSPFAEVVDPDDHVYDTHARRHEEVSYEGHRMRVPLAYVKDSDLYDRKARRKLEATQDERYNQDGDEKARHLSQGDYSFTDEFEDMVDLWEVYLPRTRRILTLAGDQGGVPTGNRDSILSETEWVGPDCGPFHWLVYTTVPGNITPKGPIQDLTYLDESFNHVWRKLIRQAARQKTIGVAKGGADQDGNRVVNASDGEFYNFDAPDLLKEFSFGGPSPANFAITQPLQQLFDFMAGGMSLLGGMAPSSKTASQDKMLNENAGRTVADMQEVTITFTARVLRALGWYWWNDPARVMEASYSPAGLPEYSVTRKLYPDTPLNRQLERMVRSVPFEKLDLKVDPYSMQFSTPQTRAAKLKQILIEEIAPLMGLLQQQGIVFDLSAYLEKRGKYEDMPDLSEIVSIAEPPGELAAKQAQSQGGEEPGMPANTTREYVRRSVGGGSAGQGENQMGSEALAMMQQGSEQNG